MKYSQENNFQVITTKDLDYEEESGYLYIKAPKEY